MLEVAPLVTVVPGDTGCQSRSPSRLRCLCLSPASFSTPVTPALLTPRLFFPEPAFLRGFALGPQAVCVQSSDSLLREDEFGEAFLLFPRLWFLHTHRVLSGSAKGRSGTDAAVAALTKAGGKPGGKRLWKRLSLKVTLRACTALPAWRARTADRGAIPQHLWSSTAEAEGCFRCRLLLGRYPEAISTGLCRS